MIKKSELIWTESLSYSTDSNRPLRSFFLSFVSFAKGRIRHFSGDLRFETQSMGKSGELGDEHGRLKINF